MPLEKRTLRRTPVSYDSMLQDVVGLIDGARHAAARAVNIVMTAAYWELGRRIVEFEQGGMSRAEYGEGLLKRLANDLTKRYGRGFSPDNLENMRRFYLAYKLLEISETPSRKLSSRKSETPSRKSRGSYVAVDLRQLSECFPLPWSAYVRLLSVDDAHGRKFYEEEALRSGWSVRQLERQINSMFYERTALSRNQAAMLEKGSKPVASDIIRPEEEIKDPYVLEFLNLKDEYSESDLEEALIGHLEHFLMELGGDFTFVGRQKRLRLGDEWYRVDLLFFHRRLRCLVVIDLKLGKFTHADAGQMHLYLNYARRHWTRPGENPPVGLILCARKNDAVARYALGNLPNKVLTAEYKTVLPKEKALAAELQRTQRQLERRRA